MIFKNLFPTLSVSIVRVCVQFSSLLHLNFCLKPHPHSLECFLLMHMHDIILLQGKPIRSPARLLQLSLVTVSPVLIHHEKWYDAND